MTQKITVEADDAMKVIIARLLGTTVLPEPPPEPAAGEVGR